MTYNPAVLRSLLRARSLNRGSLAVRLGLDRKELDRELEREPEPKQTLLNHIARDLALPAFVFYMSDAPEVEGLIPDFRLAEPTVTAKTRSTLEAIQFAQSIQLVCREKGAPPADDLPSLRKLGRKSIEQFAEQVREFFGITLADQAGSKTAREFYLICRKKIEDKGVFVLHESFPAEDGSGFCLADAGYPIIVVNTQQQTKGRRLFTLAHELGHVLLHETGISDPFSRKNSIEVLCNKFASAFLAPEGYVAKLLSGLVLSEHPDLDEVKRAASRLKISQQATALRLEQLGLVTEGAYDRWLNLIHNIGNPDYSEKGGGRGGPPPQEKVKLAKYGFRFAKAFGKLLDMGLISEINLYRATGLKPKYQRPYIDFANSLSLAELGDAELDDE